MDITEAYAILDKHNLRTKADVLCRKKKLSEIPYDAIGHNKIYCDILGEKWIELRNQLNARLKALKLTILSDTDDAEINRLKQEMNEIHHAQSVLKEAAEKDYWLR